MPEPLPCWGHSVLKLCLSIPGSPRYKIHMKHSIDARSAPMYLGGYLWHPAHGDNGPCPQQAANRQGDQAWGRGGMLLLRLAVHKWWQGRGGGTSSPGAKPSGGATSCHKDSALWATMFRSPAAPPRPPGSVEENRRDLVALHCIRVCIGSVIGWC